MANLFQYFKVVRKSSVCVKKSVVNTSVRTPAMDLGDFLKKHGLPHLVNILLGKWHS